MDRYKIYIFFSNLLIIIGILRRNILPSGIDYVLYSIFVVYALIQVYRKKIELPKIYFVAFTLFCCITSYNSFVSKYSPSLYLILFTLFLVLMPMGLFVIGYNYGFSSNSLEKLLSAIVRTITIVIAIMCIESVLRYSGGNHLFSTKWFMFGFVASLGNQALIISLYKRYFRKEKRFSKYIILISIFILATLQLKAIIGMLMIYVFFAILYFKDKVKSLITFGLIAIVALITVSMNSKLNHKIITYSERYSLENEKIARVALNLTAIKIAKDHFPLGTGLGTYGTPAVNIENSKVYEDYRIDGIYGISSKYNVDFKMDAQWASNLGEMGVAGFSVYLFLYFFPLLYYRSKRFSKVRNQGYLFFITSTLVIVFFETLTLTIANRVSFMIIYSGISSIMISVSQRNLLQA